MGFGNLISTIDTASLATTALSKSCELMHAAVMLAPEDSELQSLCRQVIRISKEACAAVSFEREQAEQQLEKLTRESSRNKLVSLPVSL